MIPIMRIDDIIAQTLALTGRLLRAHYTDPLDDDREEARRLLDACDAQQRSFAAEHGPTVANPAARVTHLLVVFLDHATFLRRDVSHPFATPASIETEHMALCHSDGSPHEDGCDKAPVYP